LNRIRRLVANTLPVLIGTLVLLGVLEVGARWVVGAPRGIFRGFMPGAEGLYPASSTIEMIWGPIPYRVSTNALGFRGPALERTKTAGVVRIAAIGDSVTDGFFVDNDATYPYFLQQALDERGLETEVINAARGSGSIDKSLAILKEAVLPLEPDIVLLTAVTNDISDLRGRTAAGVLHGGRTREPHAASESRHGEHGEHLRRGGESAYADRRQEPGDELCLRRDQPRHADHVPRRFQASLWL
jgi:hypothetical protein